MSQKLFLLFHIGRDRYALPASEVAAVLPMASLKQMPGTPPWVAGLFSHGVQHVPVIDISRLALGTASAQRLSTRLVLVHYTMPDGRRHLLGLLLERATDTLRCAVEAFAASGLEQPEAPYLGPVMRHGGHLLQWVTIDALLDEAARALLFPSQEVVS